MTVAAEVADWSPMRAETPTLTAYDRAVLHLYEGTMPGFFGSGRNLGSAAIHLGFWDGGTRSPSEAIINANRMLAEQVGLLPSERVLDAGCGFGSSAVWLAKALGAEVMGVNLSPAQTYAGRRLAYREGVADRATFERRNFTDTGYPADTFDVVWALESVCHTEDKTAFLAEAARVLKPGGRLLIADRFHWDGLGKDEDKELLGHWLRGWALPDLLETGEFCRGAQRVGLQQVRIEDFTAAVWPSVRRMRLKSLLGYPAASLLQKAGVCNEQTLAAVRSGSLQFEALARGLWFYAVFTAVKDYDSFPDRER